jgi:hypothetical protein
MGILLHVLGDGLFDEFGVKKWSFALSSVRGTMYVTSRG